METKKIKIPTEEFDAIKDGLTEASILLSKGEVIAFPTETVYGLGANALDAGACEQIFKIKGRPADNPLIVHIASVEDAKKIVREWPAEADKCAKEFWPGPLTIVLPKTGAVPEIVSGGLDTVAIRMPAHPVALELIRLCGFPLAAPSANLSGKPSPTEAKHVWQDFNGKIPLLIDAGKCAVGLESTVLDLTGERPVILRPGGVTLEQLRAILGEVEVDKAIALSQPGLLRPKSPGMKYRHYAPQGEIILLSGDKQNRIDVISKIIEKKNPKRKVALLCMEETLQQLAGKQTERLDLVFILGSQDKPDKAASRLFEGLRICDEQKMDIILAEEMPEKGIGLAFMNRLRKAAGQKDYSIPE